MTSELSVSIFLHSFHIYFFFSVQICFPNITADITNHITEKLFYITLSNHCRWWSYRLPIARYLLYSSCLHWFEETLLIPERRGNWYHLTISLSFSPPSNQNYVSLVGSNRPHTREFFSFKYNYFEEYLNSTIPLYKIKMWNIYHHIGPFSSIS